MGAAACAAGDSCCHIMTTLARSLPQPALFKHSTSPYPLAASADDIALWGARSQQIEDRHHDVVQAGARWRHTQSKELKTGHWVSGPTGRGLRVSCVETQGGLPAEKGVGEKGQQCVEGGSNLARMCSRICCTAEWGRDGGAVQLPAGWQQGGVRRGRRASKTAKRICLHRNIV